MTSPKRDLNNHSTELSQLSLRRHELLQRKKLLLVIQELRGRAEFVKSEDDENQKEIDRIEADLRELSQRRAQLQSGHDAVLGDRDRRDSEYLQPHSHPRCLGPQEPVSSLGIFCEEPPPTTPAPEVILDVNKLPFSPSRTQCPSCHQYVMTETFTSISSLTWLACFATAMIGCVAGCCLIPFCVDMFKSTTHKCPKCHAEIRTVKRL